MKILVVGGTGFLGGAMAAAARRAGHDVTVLSRGNRATGLPQITGNRAAPLPDLSHHRFDAVLDSCAFTPEGVDHLLTAVGPDIRHYVMISSISAYHDLSGPNPNETTPARPATPDELAIGQRFASDLGINASALGAAYGPLKRSAELTAIARLGSRAILLRVGLLIGAGDYTDRLTWWVRRLDQGGLIPVPLPHNRPVQMIGVRDVAAFALRLIADSGDGIYNVTGDALHLSDLLHLINPKAALRWMPMKRFTDIGLKPWRDLPLILPDDLSVAHLMDVSTTRAGTAGLTCEPLSGTLTDILAWDRTRRDTALACGITPEAEARLLAGSPMTFS